MIKNYYLSSSVSKKIQYSFSSPLRISLPSFFCFPQSKIHHLDFFSSLEMCSPTPVCRKSIQTLFAFLGSSLEKKSLFSYEKKVFILPKNCNIPRAEISKKKKKKKKKRINEWLIRNAKVEKEMGLCSGKSTKT